MKNRQGKPIPFCLVVFQQIEENDLSPFSKGSGHFLKCVMGINSAEVYSTGPLLVDQPAEVSPSFCVLGLGRYSKCYMI